MRNREIVAVVVETLKFCALQNISIRGHRDDGELFLRTETVIRRENDGNFLHLLRYRVAAGDLKFKENRQLIS